MPERECFEAAVLRVVPRVEREEFINVGVVLFCKARRFLAARIALDRARLAALAPGLVDLDEVQQHLDHIRLVCDGAAAAGPIGELTQAERFHWLVAPRSTIIQVSAAHSGLSDDPAQTLDHLMQTMVLLPK